MTPDSTTTEMERKVARAMWESEGWRHYETDEPDAKPVFHKWDDLSEGDKEYEVKRARAALKAHAEWLEEQELVVVKRNTIEPFCRGQGPALRGYINKATDWLEPLNITVTKGQFHNLWKAAQQEDQHHE